MYSLEKLKSELLLVTPDIAKSLRESAHYERQRPINDLYVERLAIEMQKGRFIAGTQVHICQIGDTLKIINGNHTLEAVIKSGVNMPLDILYTEAKSDDEIARLYARHDIGRGRDWSAVIRAAGMYDQMHMPKDLVNALGGACLYIMFGFTGFSGGAKGSSRESVERRTSRDLRVNMMREYREHAEHYAPCLQSSSGILLRKLKRAPVVAVALETIRYQPSMAREFWEGVATNDGLKRGDPRKALVSFLFESGSDGTSRHVIPRGCAAAWNAFFEKRDLQIVRVHTSSPFALAGTPWGASPKAEAFKPSPKDPTPVLKTGVRHAADGVHRVATVR